MKSTGWTDDKSHDQDYNEYRTRSRRIGAGRKVERTFIAECVDKLPKQFVYHSQASRHDGDDSINYGHDWCVGFRLFAE